MAELPGAVTALAVHDADGAVAGLTVSAFCSLSLDPPLVMAALENTTSTLPLLGAATPFTVNLLRADALEEALRFAGSGIDKMAGLDRHARGELSLERCVGWVDCTVAAQYPGGDHTIVVGTVHDVEIVGGRPLVYHRRSFGTFVAAPPRDAGT